MNDFITENTESEKERKFGFSLKKASEELAQGGRAIVLTVVLSFLMMGIVCVAVFFASVQGAEQVMVPDVKGKSLTAALLEMQAKELYPKIQLRYSDNEGDEGLILNQDPAAGAIVKAYRRVTLTVSRGVALDSITDYTGRTYNSVASSIRNSFSGELPLIKVADPIYIQDDNPAGTIIAQFPAPGTSLIDPITLTLIVSSGEEVHTTEVPDFSKKSMEQILDLIKESELVFNFKHSDIRDAKVGTVTAIDTDPGTPLTAYSHVDVEFATGESADAKSVYGIYTKELEDYPFPVPVRLDVFKNGSYKTIISFNHPGNTLTIPYQVEKGSELYLYVIDELKDKVSVE